MIQIKTVSNGWLVTDLSDPEMPRRTVVFEAQNDVNEHDVKKIQELLHHIVDLLGVAGSRNDRERVRVIIEPGDKYEPSN